MIKEGSPGFVKLDIMTSVKLEIATVSVLFEKTSEAISRTTYSSTILFNKIISLILQLLYLLKGKI